MSPAAPCATLLVGISCGLVPPHAAAQNPGDTVLMAAGPQYEAGTVRRLLAGNGYRSLWTAPLRVPVLDLRSFAGGLSPERRGGGAQTVTLHMRDAAGRRWIFRSIDKLHESAARPELQGTLAGFVLRDHVSSLHPGGQFVLPPLLDAVGILHVTPTLHVMPDDVLLGEHRDTFAGMLGALELRPEEGPDGSPGFAGSRRITGSESFFERLHRGPAERLDEREFLRARLIDFLVGDSDRGTDQWRWARFDGPAGGVWRAIPIDRDWVFVRADGALARLAGDIYPKLIRFGSNYPSIETLTYSSHITDRRLLTRLTREDFAREAARVMNALTDDVIARAVGTMPPGYLGETADWIAATLRRRRDRLDRIADEFYAWLAGEVDVHGTSEDDVAHIERLDDGGVLVRLSTRGAAARADEPGDTAASNGSAGEAMSYYERLFVPGETREVRVYLHEGSDVARVRGAPRGPIVIRVIGGDGDDVFEDAAGHARFYDHAGSNRFIRAAGTHVEAGVWSPPPPPEGLRAGLDWAPDWGADRDFGPAVDWATGAGPVLGAGPSWRRHGFRRLPHRWELDARLMLAPLTGRPGVLVDFDYRFDNSRRFFVLDARGTRYDAFRFHGFGNDTERLPSDLALIEYDRVRIEPSMRWRLGRTPGLYVDVPGDSAVDGPVLTGVLSVGPVLRWTRPRAPAGVADAGATGTDGAVTQFGARAAAGFRRTDDGPVPRRGFGLEAAAYTFPVVRRAGTSGGIDVRAFAWVPLPFHGTHLAARAGAARAFGDFPAFDAAIAGGRHTVRGYSHGRFAGDAAMHGGLELRVPVDTVNLGLLRGHLGVFGLVDAGRVWYDGRSDGPVHVGAGGGLWFSAFDQVVSAAVARGESTRVYAWLGLPF